jgi:D-lactate dehydrogenase
MEPIAKAIRNLLPADRVRDSLIDRLSYASDAGFYQLVPQVIVLPVSVEEVKQLFALSQQHKVPLVFRAGGTSLSGQSITDGILVDLAQHWRGITVKEDAVVVQPGITGGMVNHFLKKQGRKIGPDPASIHAAMMGGILSNNASGMCCGVAHNSYHTVQHLHFVLPDGSDYRTDKADDYGRFLQEQPILVRVLLHCKQQLLADPQLHDRIRRKYRMKNTIGYSLNALLDYEHPLDIFSHLLVGAEGTLAFIAEARLMTLPDKPFKAAAMLYFPDIRSACSSIEMLKESGAEALELMDYASLQSVKHLPGLPDYFQHLPEGSAAMLCEYQASSAETLQQFTDRAGQLIQTLPLLHEAVFETVEKKRMFYWKLRKGMFPSVGAMRKRGTTVILEDVAVAVHLLADAVTDLQLLFKKYDYEEAIIFGHAKDGNIHFVITQLLDSEEEIKRYDQFMQEVVGLIVGKYDGALKAEHGTGRNMAPFVETEWGGAAYDMMRQIKIAADPMGLLNPGVIINADKEAHLKNLKDLPQVEAEVDKCIECGFCEPSCPSRDLTMTPRRRIVARRALQRLKATGDHTLAKQLVGQFNYDGLATCATDGLCATDCPVSINTGELVKRLRRERHTIWQNRIANFMARHYGAVEVFARLGIGSLSAINKLGGMKIVNRLSMFLHQHFSFMPKWMNAVNRVKDWKGKQVQKPDAIYFSACINRVMQAGEKSLQQTMFELAAKAGLNLHAPANVGGHCCGQPFSSKGFAEAGNFLQAKLIDALYQWSDGGAVPVVCDFTSCTYTLLSNTANLDAESRQKFSKLRWIDSISFIDSMLMPKLQVRAKKDHVAIHPTCAAIKMDLAESLERIAKVAAVQVTRPAYGGCCGMAGDRGFLVPALSASATMLGLNELKEKQVQVGYSSASTCQMAIAENSGIAFNHIAALLNEVCEPAETYGSPA